MHALRMSEVWTGLESHSLECRTIQPVTLESFRKRVELERRLGTVSSASEQETSGYFTGKGT